MTEQPVKVDPRTLDRLLELALQEGRSISQIVADAVARYGEDRLWRATREGYERMNADPEDRAAFDAEIAMWDSTLLDGLAHYPYEEDVP